MKVIFYIVVFQLCFLVHGQQILGVIRDEQNVEIPSVKIQNTRTKSFALSTTDGQFSIAAKQGDSLKFTMNGYQTLNYVVDCQVCENLEIVLQTRIQSMTEMNVEAKRLANFDVGFLPPIKGVQIYTGTNAVIELTNQSGAKSTANPRELFAKVPGLNIWESDGAGIQMGIGGRGLSPNRTANFNTRQNGYDISADALGYPESYYTPPIEALQSIEIIRGSASLQFGTQFGGMLNFMIRPAPTNTPFEFTTRTTAGTYGYLGFFNRIAGTKKRFSYQAYHQYKRGNGYRENSEFGQHQAFAQIGYYLTEKTQIRLEYTHMNYLAKQAGGLSDVNFELDPQASFRDRNWFSVNWNLLALHYDWEISSKSHFNVRAWGMLSNRKTLGFLGKITQSDPGGNREMLSGDFKNAGIEARFLKRYDVKKAAKEFVVVNGAFLAGARYYRGLSTSLQGVATDGDQADFNYKDPRNLEGSNYEFPSQNVALFVENILFFKEKWQFNVGARLEYIESGSQGYYKQYSIHPVNFDTLAVSTLSDTNAITRTVPLFGAGLKYKVGKRSSIYLNGTQNYRAINFTDIRVNNPNIVIDSAIRDEYGYTIELGFRGMINSFFIYDLAAFHVFYGDKIGLAPKPGTIKRERTNIGDARNTGLELFSELDFLKMANDSARYGLSLFVNFSYIHACYVNSKEPSYVDKQVEYVSPILARSGLKFSTKKWQFQVQGSYNSAQFSDATNAVVPSGDAVIGEIPAYLVFDFSSRWQATKSISLEFGVNNFTNQQYYTRRATAYPGPGILPSDGINGYLTFQYKIAN